MQPAQAQSISSVLQDAGDKENQPRPTTQSAPKAPTVRSKKPSTNTEPAQVDLPASYLDIPLEEIKGEVPIYENVSHYRFSPQPRV